MSLRFLRFVFFFLTFVFLKAVGADANIETEKRGAGSAAGNGEHTDEKDHICLHRRDHDRLHGRIAVGEDPVVDPRGGVLFVFVRRREFKAYRFRFCFLAGAPYI